MHPRPPPNPGDDDGRFSDEHSMTLLAAMDRRDFLLSVQRAEEEATNAARVRAVMAAWAQRLAPYLECDPNVTIAEALERYQAEHPGGA